MRMGWAAAVAAALFAGAPAPGLAGDRESALTIIEQAIKASGGEDALARAERVSRTGSGTMSLSGNNLPFTEESSYCLPERFRMAVDLDKRFQITLVINGDKGWQVTGGTVLELSKERLEEVKEEVYVIWLTTLVPLRRESFTLTPLPDTIVEGAPVSVVKVASKGHFDAKLYFDKRTNLLVKLDRRTREAGLLLDKSYLFSDYKDVEGVKLPVRMVEILNGKKITERTSANFKLLRRVIETTFAKP